MEEPDAEAALRLWRALARRCVGSYGEHAAAPLTLAGWVAWSSGDEPSARVALGRALRVDPHYLFAKLLHQACNEGLDPELLRQCLRRDGADQAVHAAVHEELRRLDGAAAGTAPEPAGAEPPAADGGGHPERTGRRWPVRTTGPGGTTGPGASGARRRPEGRARTRRRSGGRGTRSRR